MLLRALENVLGEKLYTFYSFLNYLFRLKMHGVTIVLLPLQGFWGSALVNELMLHILLKPQYGLPPIVLLALRTLHQLYVVAALHLPI